jgi:hypothetical protein
MEKALEDLGEGAPGRLGIDIVAVHADQGLVLTLHAEGLLAHSNLSPTNYLPVCGSGSA